MPMKLNVGLSKKVGLPDYGSLGASCHVELELDGSLLRDDLERFHQHVRNAFVACREAVQDELSRDLNGAAPHNADPHAAGSAGNRHAGGISAGQNAATGQTGNGPPRNGNGQNGGRRTPSRRATDSQLRAIRAIAGQRGLDLAGELRDRFQVDRPEDLSISDASQFIDALKAAPSGAGDRA